MTLETRISALATAIGNDIKALQPSDTVTENDTAPVQGGAVFDALVEALEYVNGVHWSHAIANGVSLTSGSVVTHNGDQYLLVADTAYSRGAVADTTERDALEAVERGDYVTVTGDSDYVHYHDGTAWVTTTSGTMITLAGLASDTPGTTPSWQYVYKTGGNHVKQWNVQDKSIVATSIEKTLNHKRLQRAFDEMPIGGTLNFDALTYPVNAGLVKNRAFNIHGADPDDCFIRVDLDAGDTTTDALTIAITENNGRGDSRNDVIDGIKIQTNGGGRHSTRVDVNAPYLPINRMHVFNCNLRGTAANGGRSFIADGQLFTAATIENCQIATGITLNGCADGSTIEHNQIFGDAVGVELDIVYGAYKTTIRGNFITCRDGSIHIENGSQIDIVENQMEQSGVNAGTNSTHIDIIGSTDQSNGIRIVGNNFGGGTNIDRSIRIDNARETYIGSSNSFNTCAVEDITITANADYTRIGPDNVVRGGTRTQAPFGLDVSDAGVGTFGVIKSLTTHENSWTGGDYIKHLDNTVEFVTPFASGTTATNTIMATLPTGFWPATRNAGFVYIPCATSSGTGTLKVNSTTGRIQCGAGVTTAQVGVGSRFQSQSIA